MIRYLGKLGMLVLLGRFGRFGSFKIQGPSSNSDQTLFESRNGVKSMEKHLGSSGMDQPIHHRQRYAATN